MRILSFKSFNESRRISDDDDNMYTSDPIIVKDYDEFYQEMIKLVPKLKNAKWKFDPIRSAQIDSKFPGSKCDNYNPKNTSDAGEYTISIMHDDYDDLGWMICLMINSDTEDEVIEILIQNLELAAAWTMYRKLVGEENALVSNVLMDNKKVGTIEKWLEENPLYSSEKLKTARRTGIVDEAINMNDDILVKLRARKIADDLKKKEALLKKNNPINVNLINNLKAKYEDLFMITRLKITT